MNSVTIKPSDRERRLDEIVTAYLKAVDAGERPDPQEWLARYPDLADELSGFFAGQKQVADLLPREMGGNQTLGMEGSKGTTLLGTVRYIGDYELQTEIARGGMGVVYKARQVSLNRLVALKMILAGEHAGPDELARFRIEGEAVASLQHPHIVQIYEVGAHDGHPYFSLEFCGGGSLAQRLNGTPLPAQQAAQMIETLARAMHVAHQAGIVHRDLKPANVLLTADGSLKITDFGLAKKQSGEPGASAASAPGVTLSGAIMGTPSYMAPEQAAGRNKEVGPATDVYSLGAILYEMLTGRPPFRAAVPLETLVQVVTDEPVPPSRLQSRTPRDLETICLKCLTKEPGKRYASALTLAEDLRRFQAGEPILARPTGIMEKAGKWVRRRPVIAGLGAAVVVVTLAGVAAFAWSFGQTIQARDDAIKALIESGIARKQADSDRKQALADRKQALEDRKQAVDDRKKADDEKKRAQDNEALADWRLYALHISSAQREWERHDAKLAFHYLDSSRRDLRGWEHDYLYTLMNKNQRTLRGHTDAVFSVAFSPDGKTIFSGGLDKTLKKWDADSGRELRSVKALTHEGTRAAFSSDGKKIVIGAADWATKFSAFAAHLSRTLRVESGFDTPLLGTSFLRMWDVDSGRESAVFAGQPGPVGCLAFSPDGTMLVCGTTFTQKPGRWIHFGPFPLTLWNVRTGKEIRTLNHQDHDDPVKSVAFSPDSKKLVSGGSGGSLTLWDVESGQAIRFMLLPNRDFRGRSNAIQCVAFSPDGTKIVSGGDDRTAKVWDANSGRIRAILSGHTDTVTCISFSFDGKKIVSGGSDGLLKVWNADSGQEMLTLTGHLADVRSVAFSPDGTKIVSGSNDKTVRVWHPLSGPAKLTISGNAGNPMNHWGTAFSADGKKTVADSKEGLLVVKDVLTGLEISTLKEERFLYVRNLAFNPSGTKLLVHNGDKTLTLWDVASGRAIRTLATLQDHIPTLVFSSDGKRIFTGSASGEQYQVLDGKVWDEATGQVISTLTGHTDIVWGAAFSPDGTRIVTAGRDQTLKLWDVASGREIRTFKGHTGPVTLLAFSPDGKKIASGSWDNTAKVWDAGNGQELLTLKGHTGNVLPVAFSPDCKRIVSGSADKTVKVWDAQSGQEILTLRGHTHAVMSVAFSPDGKTIISTASDGTVKFWDGHNRP